MNFFEILNSLLWEKNIANNFICPICNREIISGLIHEVLDHSIFFDNISVNFFIEKYKTDLISFHEDYFYVVFYEEKLYFKALFNQKFEYDYLKDFEINTIKEFVYKVKRNLIFL
jgi:hypothetical protein